jgi:rod shape determining protein RodA
VCTFFPRKFDTTEKAQRSNTRWRNMCTLPVSEALRQTDRGPPVFARSGLAIRCPLWQAHHMRRWLEIFSRYDWSLLLAATALSAIGLLAIYGIGISAGTNSLFQFKKQLIGLLIGEGIALGLAFVDFRHIKALAIPIYAGALAILGSVLVIGTTSRNAGRWFSIGSLSFQPVEIAKVALAIFLAAYLARYVHRRLTWIPFLGSLLATALYVGLVLLQPDFGSAMVLVALWGAVVLFCGLPKHAWWVLLLTVTVVGAFLWTVGLKPYQRDRITAFLHPTNDPYGISYNVTQARIAIGSGGWLGKGIGEGSQARLRFLPESSTDFMFAVLGEELGFVGLAFVLGLFGFLLYRYVRIAMEAEDAFAGIMMIGLATVILFHLVINAGMNLGLLPVTGIPLPFASAAASSLISVFITVGLAESVAVRSKGMFR